MDGPCLHPDISALRLAAFAVVRPTNTWEHVVVWRGMVPTCDQHIDRAEILAAAAAAAAYRRVSIFSDSSHIVKTGNKIIDDLRNGINPQLPMSNLDCWFSLP